MGNHTKHLTSAAARKQLWGAHSPLGMLIRLVGRKIAEDLIEEMSRTPHPTHGITIKEAHHKTMTLDIDV